MRPPDSCKLPISISFASSTFVGPVGHSVIPRPIRSWRCSCSRNICREKPVFAGKVTSGARNETSGQSWRSNTIATDPFTGKTGIQSVAAVSSTNVWAVGAQRLVPSVSNASLHWDGSTWSLELLTFLANQPRQRPFYSCDGRGLARLPATARLPVRKPGPVER